MARREHVELLQGGVEAWNRDRPDLPDLTGADLTGADLTGADLIAADLTGAKLSQVNLCGADLVDTILVRADLTGANLTGANLLLANLCEAVLVAADLYGAKLRQASLIGADLRTAILARANLGQADLAGVDLTGANLHRADLNRVDLTTANLSEAILSDAVLIRADLTGANLTSADLTSADLTGANLTSADLTSANLRWAKVIWTTVSGTKLHGAAFVGTILADVDLRSALGLAQVDHQGPSSVGVDTLYRSEAEIPEVFLRGCGVPKLFIDYSLDAVRPTALEFHSAFISYSSKDATFAERLHDDLFNGERIPCWLDQHQLAPGDDLDQTIFGAIRNTDKILLVCTEASLTSWWVDREISRGMDKEHERHGRGGRRTPLIIPLDLDGYIFSDECEWSFAKDLTRRVVAKFKDWETDETAYAKALAGVVNALRASGPLKPFLPPPIT